MIPAKAALRPKYEAPRAVLADRRGTTNFINSNDVDDNTTAIRRQCLRHIGVQGSRADMLAGMVWEARHG